MALNFFRDFHFAFRGHSTCISAIGAMCSEYSALKNRRPKIKTTEKVKYSKRNYQEGLKTNPLGI